MYATNVYARKRWIWRNRERFLWISGRKRVNWPSLGFYCINPLIRAEFRELTYDSKAKLWQIRSSPSLIQISPSIQSQNLDRVNSGPNTLHPKGQKTFISGLRFLHHSANSGVVRDIKLLGLSLLFLERQNPDSTRFFSLPVSHFPSCQVLVT